MKHILLLSNDALLSRLFLTGTKKFNLQTIISSDLEQTINTIRKGDCSAIVINIPILTERCPKKIVRQIQETNPYLPVYVLMDQMDISEAISLTKMGVEYCYSKPFALEQIIENIDNTLKNFPATAHSGIKKIAGDSYKEKNDRPKYVYATSQPAKELYDQIDKVADTNFKVVIYGETGTGKESVARRLCKGKYKNRPFVAVDCGCLRQELAASELFGHKKGSFSGAIEEKKGAFEAANGGSIFLDEIGNLDYSVQNLLLRAIEEHKIRKVGSNEEIDINVRIIVASNEKLSDAVENGTFREDLYFRLNEFEIVIPPLRDRIEDLELFIDFFIQEANHDLGKNIQGINADLLEKFKLYQWPGNIRELKNTIRRGCLMATSLITPSCLSSEFMEKLNDQIKLKDHIKAPDQSMMTIKDDLKFKSIISEYEEIVKILKEEKYNKTKAAMRLNINRKTLYNKLKAFDTLSETNK